MVNEIEMRLAIDSDAEALSQLICENAQEILSRYYNDRQWNVFMKYYSIDVMREKVNTQHVFCAELNGQIVGTIALDKDFVVGFYTRLNFQNRGIGKAMMMYLEKFALEKGLDVIQLAASPIGLLFYNKNGWLKIKDTIVEYYGVGFEETLMFKKLK